MSQPRLTLNDFWKMIDHCQSQVQQHSNLGTEHARNEHFLHYLTQQLNQLTPKNVLWFHHHMTRLDSIAWRYDLWAVLHIISGGMSDDAFDYTRAWLIAQGKQMYEATMRNVLVVEQFQKDSGRFVSELEELLSLPETVYEQKTGRSMYSLTDAETVKDHPEDEYPTWATDTVTDAWEDTDLPRLFPQLCKEYGFL